MSGAMEDRQRYLARQARYNRSEKGRARSREWYRKHADDPAFVERERKRSETRRCDPEYRRKMTLYGMDYRHQSKRARYEDEGLTTTRREIPKSQSA